MQRFYETRSGHYDRRGIGLYDLVDLRGSRPESDRGAMGCRDNLDGTSAFLPYGPITRSNTSSIGNVYSGANDGNVAQHGVPPTTTLADPVPDFQPYLLSRGNGQYTRLIPADTLPPLNEVPPREVNTEGHFVLPTISPRERRVTLKKVEGSHGPDTVQSHIDRIVSNTPSSKQKREKIYCDKWVHEGVCAFTQQGCRYKHVMPLDQKTQHDLGLFHGLPAWWRKHQAEVAKKEIAASGEAVTPTSSSLASSPDSGRMGRPKQVVVGRGLGNGYEVRVDTKSTNDFARSEVSNGTRDAFKVTESPSRNDLGFGDAMRRTGNPVGRHGMGMSRSSGHEPCRWGPIQPPKVADTNTLDSRDETKSRQYP